MMILLFYPQIDYFYTYSVPLNKMTVVENAYSDDPEIFQKTRDKEDSACFTTPSANLFCYEKPRMYETTGVSYVRGETGIDGELHFDPIDVGVGYFTMKNMTKVNEDTALITFSDNDYRVGNEERTKYEIKDKFEFTAVVEKYDTFITNCNNFEGTSANLVQYLGITTIDGIDYFMTWHTLVKSENGIRCDYPQVIQVSLKHDFGL